MNHCIINFGKGAWYPRGQARLVQSLKDVGYTGKVYAWSDETQIGSPSHQAAPYAFKVHAFKRAIEAGHDVVLWCDSAVWAWHDVMPIMNYIADAGHVFFQGGWNCGQWTSDACLKQFHISRDAAEKMPMFMACCMGLDFRLDRSLAFLRRLEEKANDGISLPGCWSNQNQEVSADPRCLGHRHDQSAGSIIAYQLGMEQIVGHQTFFQYYGNPAGTAFRYGEQNDMSSMNPKVCLLTQGM